MSTPTFDDGSYRFSPIDDNDHAGYVWIVTILGLIYSLLGGLVRARIKWGIHGPDDYLLGMATVSRPCRLTASCLWPSVLGILTLTLLPKIILFGQSIAIIYGLNNGLAKSNAVTPESDWALSGKVGGPPHTYMSAVDTYHTFSQSFLASEVLSVIILCLAKCSVVALIFRVFTIDIDRTWLLCFGTLIISAVWGVGSMIAIVVNCDPNTILTVKEVTTCPEQVSFPFLPLIR